MKIPKGETVWVRYFSLDGRLLFLITSKVMRDFYYLYEVKGDNIVKIGKSQSPVDLEEKFELKKRIGADE